MSSYTHSLTADQQAAYDVLTHRIRIICGDQLEEFFKLIDLPGGIGNLFTDRISPEQWIDRVEKAFPFVKTECDRLRETV